MKQLSCQLHNLTAQWRNSPPRATAAGCWAEGHRDSGFLRAGFTRSTPSWVTIPDALVSQAPEVHGQVWTDSPGSFWLKNSVFVFAGLVCTNCDGEAVTRQVENWQAAIRGSYISFFNEELRDQKRYFQWSGNFIKIGRSTKFNLLGNIFPGGAASLGADVKIRKHAFPLISADVPLGVPIWHTPAPCFPTPVSVSSVDGLIQLHADRTSSCHLRCPGIKNRARKGGRPRWHGDFGQASWLCKSLNVFAVRK